MSVEVRPLGDRCNIQCTYCYQETARAGELGRKRYSVTRMIETLSRLDQPFTLFGGEALLVPIADLEQLFAYGLERYGRNGIQTNGTLLRPDHIALFRRYQVDVGVSIDGPGALNDIRWAGSRRATQRATARTEAGIEILCRTLKPPSVIVTLHRHNASEARLPLLLAWIRYLDRLGISRMRLHLLEVDNALAETACLSEVEAVDALDALRALERELQNIRFDVFAEMRQMLRGDDEKTSCIWHACDIYATLGVQGVEGNGQRSNCGRTNKDGISYLSADRRGFERQLALYSTPWESGGCAGCRFFLMCKGNCPGTGLKGDWRMRSEHCGVWYRLFEELEAEMLISGELPLSRAPARSAIEDALLEQWDRGVDETIASVKRRLSI